MKNKFKHIGIIAVVALIVFSLAACEENSPAPQGTYTWTNENGGVVSVTFSENNYTWTAPGGEVFERTFTMSGKNLRLQSWKFEVVDANTLTSKEADMTLIKYDASGSSGGTQAAQAQSGSTQSGGGNTQAAPAQSGGRANAESDFKVSLTSDGTGVVIERYTGTATGVVIPATIQGMPVRVIGFQAFEIGKISTRINSVVIPEGVTEIGSAFSMQKNLESVTLPSTLKSLGSGAFSACTSLTSITLPEGLTEIGGSTFIGAGLTAFPVWPKRITSIPAGMFEVTKLSGNLVIPEGITEIRGSAFLNCKGLTSVTLPSTIREISNYAFDGCDLTSITIPDSVRRIYFLSKAFEGNPRLPLATQARLKQLGYTDCFN